MKHKYVKKENTNTVYSIKVFIFLMLLLNSCNKSVNKESGYNSPQNKTEIQQPLVINESVIENYNTILYTPKETSFKGIDIQSFGSDWEKLQIFTLENIDNIQKAKIQENEMIELAIDKPNIEGFKDKTINGGVYRKKDGTTGSFVSISDFSNTSSPKLIKVFEVFKKPYIVLMGQQPSSIYVTYLFDSDYLLEITNKIDDYVIEILAFE